MAKRAPVSEAAAMIAAASQQNPASRGLALDRPEYDELRQLLEAYVFARAASEHRCGMPWFIDHGVPSVNADREKNGLSLIPTNVTHTTLLSYARKKWPKQAEAFRR